MPPTRASSSTARACRPRDRRCSGSTAAERRSRRHTEDNYSSLRISPDGTRVAIGRRNAAGSDDQWVLDLARSGATRLTFDPARETYPVWSPDGAQIAFAANPAGTYQVYRMPAAGGGKQQQLTRT